MRFIRSILVFLSATFTVLVCVELGSAFWFFLSSPQNPVKSNSGFRTPLIDFSTHNYISRFRKSELNRRRRDYFEADPFLGIRFRSNSEVFTIIPSNSGEPVYSDQGLITDQYGLIANSSKFEDKYYDLNKIINDASIFRIVVSGSSTAIWGASRNENTWPAQLQTMLNSDKNLLHKLGYSKAVVFNTGVFSYTVAQEALRLITETSYWRPNLIISFNGPAQVNIDYSGNPFDFSVHWAQRRLIDRSKIDSIFMPLNILPYTSIFLTSIIKDRRIDAYGYRQNNYPKMTFVPLYLSKIKQMETIAKSTNADFLWVLNPLMEICPGEILTESEEPTKIFFEQKVWKLNWNKYIAQSRKVFFQLGEVIKNSNKNNYFDFTCLFSPHSERVYDDPRHYTDFGHRIVANRIYKEIKNRFEKQLNYKSVYK